MGSAPIPEPSGAPGGEAAAYVAELFERHGRMVFGLCRALLRDVHEAEDATQQAFLAAYRALLAGARVREAAAWLAAIARNECRARIAAGMRSPLPVADDDLEALAAPADEAARRALAEALQRALAELPERQRQAVVLRYLYGLRYGEVATALGLSRPATEALLFRARRALKLRLRPVAGSALALPLAVRDGLADAIPGFAASVGGGAGTAAVAGGLLAKLVATPAGAKVATAAVAVGAVGAAGAVQSDRGLLRPPAERPAAIVALDARGGEARPGRPARVAGEKAASTAVPSRSDEARSEGRHSRDGRSERSGRRGDGDDLREGRAGPGAGAAGPKEEEKEDGGPRSSSGPGSGVGSSGEPESSGSGSSGSGSSGSGSSGSGSSGSGSSGSGSGSGGEEKSGSSGRGSGESEPDDDSEREPDDD